MKRESKLIFDESVASTAPAGAYAPAVTTYTSLEHTDFLQAADRVIVEATATATRSRTTIPVSITLEHSGDGRSWFAKSTLLTADFAVGTTTTKVGGEKGPHLPSLRFARLRIDAGSGREPFAMRLALRATGRTRRVGRGARAMTMPFGPPRNYAVAPATSSAASIELQAHLEHVDASQPDAAVQVLARLSHEARAEVTSLAHRLARLPPASRVALARAGRALELLMSALPTVADE